MQRKKRRAAKAAITKLAGVKTYESLKITKPDKFSKNVVNFFKDSVAKKNSFGKAAMERYVEQSLAVPTIIEDDNSELDFNSNEEGKIVSQEVPAEVEDEVCIEETDPCTESVSLLSGSDNSTDTHFKPTNSPREEFVIVEKEFRFSKKELHRSKVFIIDSPHDKITPCVFNDILEAKSFKSIIALCDDEESHLDVFNSVAGLVDEETTIKQIYFSSLKPVLDGSKLFSQNVKYGVLVCKTMFIRPPIKIYRGQLSSLTEVISNVSSPHSKVAVLHCGSCPIVPLLFPDRKVLYIAGKKKLDELLASVNPNVKLETDPYAFSD